MDRVFKQIHNTVNDRRQLTGISNFNFTLPRQCGATTFLAELALEEIEKEKRVLFIVPNKGMYDALLNFHFMRRAFESSKLDLVVIPCNHNFLRGRKYDVVLIDSVFSKHYHQLDLINHRAFLNLIINSILSDNGYSLKINTVESAYDD